MATLTCPLCCKATFSSRFSLNCHIRDVVRSLKCPSCHRKMEGLSELAEHLEKECSADVFLGPVKQEEPGLEDAEDARTGEAEERQQGGGVGNDTAALQALLEGDGADEDGGALEGAQLEVGQYFCEMCDLHFDDIDGHLADYHEGQEVVVEEEGNDANKQTETDANAPAFSLDSSNITLVINGFEDQDEEPLLKSPQPRRQDTVTQQDFKDKDGRLYTRKFVKIDKFWLQGEHGKAEPPAPKEPTVHKYLLENGDVRRLSQEEAGDVQDLSAVVEIYKCPDCDLLFPVLDNYRKHKCETPSGDFECIRCLASFDTPEALRTHLKTHSAESALKRLPKKSTGPFNCDVCNTVFPTFKSLRLHAKMHNPVKARETEPPPENNDETQDVRQMFICHVCHKTYDTQFEEIHMNSHSADNGFNCEVCNRKFFTQSNLEMHMKAHTNNKKFQCSYCKKPFVTYDSLEDHLKNQCQKRLYACQYCGRRFARPHEKVKHERIHTGEKPHVCGICGKSFRVSYCLTLHLRTHSGTRPYQCSHCGKRFKSHSVYNHHMQTHSDVRAYKCPFCPKAFKTSVQLAGHKNSHTKPFPCTECNRPFASLYAVRSHMETHKRDNNLRYECWICGALYSRTFALRDHIKQQHQQEVTDKSQAVVLDVEEEMDAASAMLVKEDDIILGLGDSASIEIIENSGEL